MFQFPSPNQKTALLKDALTLKSISFCICNQSPFLRLILNQDWEVNKDFVIPLAAAHHYNCEKETQFQEASHCFQEEESISAASQPSGGDLIWSTILKKCQTGTDMVTAKLGRQQEACLI